MMSSTESINSFMIRRLRDEQIKINNNINQLNEVISKLQESLDSVNNSMRLLSKKSRNYNYEKLINSLLEESILMKLAIHGYEKFRGDEFGSVKPEQIINSSAGFDVWVLEGMKNIDEDFTLCLKSFLERLRYRII